METLTINSTNSELLLDMYKKITEEMANDVTSVSLSYDKNDVPDEEKMDIRTYGEDKWIRFGDMMNILQEQDDENELGNVNQSDLMFTCKSFEDGEFILLRHIECHGGVPCMVKVHKKNDFSIYIPSFEEMFNYMWKEV